MAISCCVYSGFKIVFWLFFLLLFVFFFAFLGSCFCVEFVVLFENCLFWSCLPSKRSVFGVFLQFFRLTLFEELQKKGFFHVHCSKGFFSVSAFIVFSPEATIFIWVPACHRFLGVGGPNCRKLVSTGRSSWIIIRTRRRRRKHREEEQEKDQTSTKQERRKWLWRKV